MKRILAAVIISITALSAAPYVVPDTGWTGDTDTPAAIGSSGDAGYDAKVIGRWDIVPHQDVIDSFNAGVVAFHMNGIEKVSFAVDGGAWTDVTEMRLNERTDVWEYFVTLRPDDFTEEGKVELRAIAYPKDAGVARVFSGMELFIDKGSLSRDSLWVDPVNGNDAQTVAGGGGTSTSPFKTIEMAITRHSQGGKPYGGLVVYCVEGSYPTPAMGNTNYDRWITITAAPGADPALVKFTSRPGRCDLKRLKMTNVTWAPTYNTSLFYPGGPDRINRHFWLDNMDLIGTGRATHGQCHVQEATVYETNLFITETTQGVYNIQSNVPLVRNVHIDKIAEDAFRVNQLIINCSVNNMDKDGSSAHPDVIQYGGYYAKNFIVYNLKATDVKSQGIYIRGENWALVNTFIQQNSAAGYLWQIDNVDSVKHVLLWHCGTVNQTLNWRTGSGTEFCKNISIRNCAWSSMGCGTNSKGEPTDCASLAANAMEVDNNHFQSGTFTEGTNSTSGDPGFADMASGDYRPADGSLLAKRSTAMLIPCDADNNPRAETTAIGAFRGETETPSTGIGTPAAAGDMVPLMVTPNPFRDQVRIMSGLLDLQNNVSATVFDADGNLVRSLVDVDPARALWDGRNEQGVSVPGGQYYLVITTSVHRYLAPVLLVR